MKKLLFWISTLLLWSISFIHAQSLWYIEASFCNSNQENQVDIIANTEQETDICINFKNISDEDITINIDFVDWALSSVWEKSCGIPEDENPRFKPFVQNFEKELTIWWHSTVQKNYKVIFPMWYTWISHGCLTYSIADNSTWWWLIRLVSRKTHSIDILVWWEKVESKISIKKAFITWDINWYRLAFIVENIGNINQNISITWIIKNWFGYNYDYSVWDTVINAKSTQILMTKDIAIPSYKWLFTTKSALAFTPIFDFDITSDNGSNEYSLPWVVNISNTIILWNRILIVWISIIILLILVIIIKTILRKKKTQKQ